MEVSSAPYLIDPVNFGLGDYEKNKEKLISLYAKYPNKEIGIYSGSPLIEFTVSNKESYIVLEDEGEIIYFVHLKAEQLKQLHSNSVTQVEVWRRSVTKVDGLASHVFFDILLHRYSYIVSDSSQSENGKYFWLRMLDRAASKGCRVGVMFDTDPVDWHASSATFKTWIRVVESEAWGHELNKHYYYRFVIES